MPIKCVLKWQPPFLTPVKKCMNWHICKLISVFLQWPRLPSVLGCCILCPRKAKNISHSQNLCAAGEMSFLKQVLRQEGGVDFRFSVAWRKRRDSIFVSWLFRGPICYSFALIYPRQKLLGNSSYPLPTLSLFSPSSDPRKPFLVFILPTWHPFCPEPSPGRGKALSYMVVGKIEFPLWIVSYWMYLSFQDEIKPRQSQALLETILIFFSEDMFS